MVLSGSAVVWMDGWMDRWMDRWIDFEQTV